MPQNTRRKFIKTGTAALAVGTTGLLAACAQRDDQKIDTPNINFNKTYRWKMVTTWPPNFPVLGEGCNLLSQWIADMSGGRMTIDVYGGGELIPSLECFDAVSNGAVEMGSGASYYWAGKIPAAQFFASVPFGMNAQQMNAWIINAGGNKLWDELYDPFDLIPLPGGNTGVQAGGWFNKEINALSDFEGLKMRMPGLGAKVLRKAGGTAVLVAGTELFTNLERGVIDATEWIGPYHDYLMGFHRVAKYYYYPGWHEPGTVLEIILNKGKFLSLPKDLQEIIKAAVYRINQWMLTEFEQKNAIYLQKMIAEKIDIRPFPDEVLAQLKPLAEETVLELVESDEKSKKIFEHYSNFKKQIGAWSDMSEKFYYEKLR